MAGGWAAAAGQIAGVAGNIGAQAIANNGSRKRERESRHWNEQMWHKQNSYNHPVNQMKRLKKAGLNPNLIYGTGGSTSVGNADKVSPAKAADYNFESPFKDLAKFADVRQVGQQTDNLQKQNDVLVQEAANKAAQTADTVQKTSKGKFDLDLAKELRKNSVDASNENLRQMEQRSMGAILDTKFKDQTLKARVQESIYRMKTAQSTLKGQQLLNALRKEQLDLKKLGVEPSDNMFFRLGIQNWKLLQDALTKKVKFKN